MMDTYLTWTMNELECGYLTVSGADSMGYGGTCLPTFTNGWARGGVTVGRRTTNKKLTKLY